MMNNSDLHLTRSARVTSPLVIAISAHLAGDNPFSSWHDAHTLDLVAGAMTDRPDRFFGEGWVPGPQAHRESEVRLAYPRRQWVKEVKL